MTRVSHSPSDRLIGIQILRGLAAMCVVFYHIQLLAEKNGIDSDILVNPILAHMYYGVDIFFVISGFIMTKTVIRNDMTASKFIKNRLIRVVPLYWFLTIIFFVGINSLSKILSIRGYSYKDLLSSITFVSGIAQGRVPIIDQGWSLEYEMIFYVLIAYFMIFAKGLKTMFLAIFALIIFCSFGLDLVVLEFAYGIGIYIIVSKFKLPRCLLRSVLVLGVVILLFASLSGIGNDYRFILFGFPAALIVLGSTSVNVRSGSRLVLLGEISYSLYLSQSLILWWLVQFAIQINLVNVQLIFLVCLVPMFCIIAGYSVYKFVEQPIDRLIKNLLKSVPGPQ